MSRRQRDGGLTADDVSSVARVVPHWSRLSPDAQATLLEDTDTLLRRKRWEAARGFTLSHGMRVLIAAGAARLVVGLSTEAYRQVRTIIVHPSRVVRDGVRAGPMAGVVTDGPITLVGETMGGEGPVLIASDQAWFDATHPWLGRNVVHHEFAHKLDQLDGDFDGVPPLPEPQRSDFQSTMESALARARRGELSDAIDDYGATNLAELFAVATEAFFSTPERLASAAPDVYRALRWFYRQDPVREHGSAHPGRFGASSEEAPP